MSEEFHQLGGPDHSSLIIGARIGNSVRRWLRFRGMRTETRTVSVTLDESTIGDKC